MKRGRKPRMHQETSGSPNANTTARDESIVSTSESQGQDSYLNWITPNNPIHLNIAPAIAWSGVCQASESHVKPIDLSESYHLPSSLSETCESSECLPEMSMLPSEYDLEGESSTRAFAFDRNLSIQQDTNTSNPNCVYPCLGDVMPLLNKFLAPGTAQELFNIFFSNPSAGLVGIQCPYVLSPVIRKASLLRREGPRPVSPALVCIILWCVSQTANLAVFNHSGARDRLCRRLYDLSMKLLRARGFSRTNNVPGEPPG